MNQILMTENNDFKNNRNNKKEKKVKSRSASIGDFTGVVKVFAVLILIFGLAISGSGAYAMISDIQATKTSKVPSVSTQRSGNAVTIVVSCETGIRSMVYSWNDSSDTVVSGKNKSELTQVVTIPAGDNRLNIAVIDSNGKQTKFVKNFIQAAKDVTEPVIEFEVVGSNIKIIVTDDTAIDYMTYKMGDSTEVTVTAETEGQTTIEETIPVPQGQNTLIVEAVDKEQNFATKEQEVKGVKKPVVEVTPDPSDPSYLIIKATDEEGLRMVSFYINGQEYKTDPNTSLNSTTFEWKQKVEHGENNVIVHAYNINEQVTEFVGIYTY